MTHSIRYTILCLSLLLIALLPIFINAFDENIDPFSFSTVGLAETYSKTSHYSTSPYDIKNPIEWQSNANEVSVRAVPVLIYLMLQQVTGLSLSTFIFLPIAGLVFTLLVFMLAKKFVKSDLIAVLFVLVMNFTSFPVNVYYISIGLCLFLFFVVVWLKFMESEARKSSLVFLLFIIFVALYYSYYTAEFLVFCLLFGAMILPWLAQKIFNLKVPKMRLLSLLICFIVIFAYFDYEFYNFFLLASPDNVSASFSSYFSYVLRFLQVGGSAVTDYRPQISNPVVVYADLFQRALIMLPIALYVIYFLRNYKKQDFDLGYKGVALLSLFFVGIMQILLYSSVGYSQQIWSLFLALAITAFFSIDFFGAELNKRKKVFQSAFLAVIMVMIVVTGGINFAFRITDPVNPNGYQLYSSINPAISWSVSHLDSGYMAADSRTAAELFFEVAKADKANIVYPYRISSEVSYLYNLDSETPQKLFGNKTVCFLVSYEFKERSFLAGNQWSYCPPLGNALSYLDMYPSLNKVYDDGLGLVYRYEPNI